MNLYSKRPGSSIIEQLLVLGIILFVAAMVTRGVMGLMRKVDVSKTKIIMTRIHGAITQYTQDMVHPPLAEEGNLNALITRPRGPAGKDWQGSYLPGEAEVPVDGFKKDFYYSCPPRKFKGLYKRFELYSQGADEENDISDSLRTGD